jgi:hypothetical protein
MHGRVANHHSTSPFRTASSRQLGDRSKRPLYSRNFFAFGRMYSSRSRTREGTVTLSGQSSEPEDRMVRRALRLYWKSVDNNKRQAQGLPPTPYTQEELRWERELDMQFLKETLPLLLLRPRDSDTETQELLKLMERDVRYRFERLLGCPEE